MSLSRDIWIGEGRVRSSQNGSLVKVLKWFEFLDETKRTKEETKQTVFHDSFLVKIKIGAQLLINSVIAQQQFLTKFLGGTKYIESSELCKVNIYA